ncbi:hypothetical protein J1D01_15085 [Seonamhaeicola sp. NFXS20]|uniref:glycoside hydrolase family 2 protein n=1 Tax=Seonamhaeicola sp. NFXS20 TaxID=2816959 RepID=UPI003B8B461F
MKSILYLVVLACLFSCKDFQNQKDETIVLNGLNWTFRPIKIPFFGYELDAEGRWREPNQNHDFIVKAINDSLNRWSVQPVRVPMSWSSAVSNPGEKEVKGDFDFPYFWQYVHKGEYKTTFDLPDDLSGKRIKIDFSSVNFVCWVFVNGQLIKGENPDKSYTHLNKLPFTVDITKAVKAPSKNNELKIVVQDFSYAFKGDFPNEDHPETGIDYPLGDRCDYYNKDRGWRNIDNGIIGDVVLRGVPEVNVNDLFIQTDVDSSRITASIEVWNQSECSRQIEVGGFVTDWKGEKTVFELNSKILVTLEPNQKKNLKLSDIWESPKLWWPYNPHLYDFNVTINGVSVHKERFGFRQVKAVQSNNPEQRGFYLNGIKMRLRGESLEPTWKDGYTEGVGGGLFLYNPEYWSYLLDISKELNINVLRTHRGMSLKRQFEIADEKGMLMIAESTINNGNHKGAFGTIENQRKAIRDLIKKHRNHPSIVFWSLANETPYQEEWEEEALKYDKTRPLTATQLSPRYYLSENIVTAACSYSMGLDGYTSDIYNRHDKFWKDKLLYVYEDNACYDEPLDYDRVSSVQKGLSIFRGHRSTGYEMIFTFYTLQKLFGQPTDPKEKHFRINWEDHDVKKVGYRPDYALMPLLDPWTNPETSKIINPIEGMKDNPIDFWKRSYSPIAVFDYEYDKRTDVSASANPYVSPLSSKRILTIHNDDIRDTTTVIDVKWQVKLFDKDQMVSQGEFSLNVPLAGIKKQDIALDLKNNDSVRVTYQAFKSGTKRFEETVYLSNSINNEKQIIEPLRMTGESVLITPNSKAISHRGFHLEDIKKSSTRKLLVNNSPKLGDYVQFNPWINETGLYDVYLQVPENSKGIQKVAVQHDTHNTELNIDFSKKQGWVKLNKEPIKFKAGKYDNSVKLLVSNNQTKVRIGTLKIKRTTN